MPEVETILGKARSLQPHNPFEDRDPEGDEVWNGIGHSARFSLSREGAQLDDQGLNIYG